MSLWQMTEIAETYQELPQITIVAKLATLDVCRSFEYVSDQPSRNILKKSCWKSVWMFPEAVFFSDSRIYYF